MTARIFATILSAPAVLVPFTLTPEPVWATTLQKLSTDAMIQQSTAIVRARVTGSSTALRGHDVYTYYQLTVLENLKSTSPQSVQVAIPGGTAGGIHQMAIGAPTLIPGQEYVVFLWTSKSGLTQVIGLSQGLFTVMQTSSGDTVLIRPAATDLMLDTAGHLVNDSAVVMRLADLRTEIQSVLSLATTGAAK